MTASRVLAILIAALLAALAWVWIEPLGPWQPPRPVIPEVSRVPGDAGGAPPPALAHALTRPVFWVSRRAEAEPAEAPSGFADNARLLGLIGQGGNAVAIVSFDGKTSRLVPGKSVGGWRFDGLDAGHAVFSRPGSENQRLAIPKKLAQELPLKPGGAASPAPGAGG